LKSLDIPRIFAVTIQEKFQNPVVGAIFGYKSGFIYVFVFYSFNIEDFIYILTIIGDRHLIFWKNISLKR